MAFIFGASSSRSWRHSAVGGVLALWFMIISIDATVTLDSLCESKCKIHTSPTEVETIGKFHEIIHAGCRGDFRIGAQIGQACRQGFQEVSLKSCTLGCVNRQSGVIIRNKPGVAAIVDRCNERRRHGGTAIEIRACKTGVEKGNEHFSFIGRTLRSEVDAELETAEPEVIESLEPFTEEDVGEEEEEEEEEEDELFDSEELLNFNNDSEEVELRADAAIERALESAVEKAGNDDAAPRVTATVESSEPDVAALDKPKKSTVPAGKTRASKSSKLKRKMKGRKEAPGKTNEDHHSFEDLEKFGQNLKKKFSSFMHGNEKARSEDL